MNTAQTTEKRQEAAKKAAQTKRERKERQEAAERAHNSDLPIALLILRQIRDNPASTGLEKILAIKMLTDISK